MVSRSVMAVIIYLFMYFLLKRDVGLMSKEPGGLLVGGAGVMGHKPHTLGPEGGPSPERGIPGRQVLLGCRQSPSSPPRVPER